MFYDPVTGRFPSSRRIVKDCKKGLHVYIFVYNNKGQLVPGLANRNGHCNRIEEGSADGGGGSRVK